METRAPYVVIGSFTIAVIFAVFGFVYWFHNTGGLKQRTSYQIRFEQPVAGLTSGSAVQFNGVRVGEVTGLRIEPDHPQGVLASIGIDAGTPVRADTTADVEYQGLTGVASISLKGGAADAAPLARENGAPPTLKANANAGESLTQTARETLRRIDTVIDDNRKSLNVAVTGFGTFADMLGRNSGRIEEVLGGLERLTGGGEPKTPPTVFDLAAATDFPKLDKNLDAPLAVPDPVAVLTFDSQKILIRSPEGTYTSVENAQWADNLPKLMQAKIVQSFENANQLQSVSRRTDDMNASNRLAIEIRNFQISLAPEPTAVIEFAARLLGDDGKVIDARMFKATAPAKSIKKADAVPALNEAFSHVAQELVVWTVTTL
jgi:phospholipid/cholesterol/gamma-HCH transport system substrate-binding protein